MEEEEYVEEEYHYECGEEEGENLEDNIDNNMGEDLNQPEEQEEVKQPGSYVKKVITKKYQTYQTGDDDNIEINENEIVDEVGDDLNKDDVEVEGSNQFVKKYQITKAKTQTVTQNQNPRSQVYQSGENQEEENLGDDLNVQDNGEEEEGNNDYVYNKQEIKNTGNTVSTGPIKYSGYNKPVLRSKIVKTNEDEYANDNNNENYDDNNIIDVDEGNEKIVSIFHKSQIQNQAPEKGIKTNYLPQAQTQIQTETQEEPQQQIQTQNIQPSLTKKVVTTTTTTTVNAPNDYQNYQPEYEQDSNVVSNVNPVNVPQSVPHIVRKNEYGKILEERENYRFFVSGIGYVDAKGQPIKDQSKKQVVRKIPVVQTTQKVEYDDPNVIELIPNQNPSIYEKRSTSSEPTHYFRNLGTISKTNESGKKKFYHVIETTPLDYNDEVQEYQPIRTVLRPAISQPQPKYVESHTNNLIPLKQFRSSPKRVTKTTVSEPYLCDYCTHNCSCQYPQEEVRVVRETTCLHQCPFVSSSRKQFRSRDRIPANQNYVHNKVVYQNKYQPEYFDNYKFHVIKGTCGKKKSKK